MRKEWAKMSWEEADVIGAIDYIKQDNEGRDPPFELELSKIEAAEFLDRIETDLECEVAACGLEFMKERLKAVYAARKDQTLGQKRFMLREKIGPWGK